MGTSDTIASQHQAIERAARATGRDLEQVRGCLSSLGRRLQALTKRVDALELAELGEVQS